MIQVWKKISENIQVLFTIGMNLIVAIIYPIYLPLFFPEGSNLLNIVSPEYYSSPNSIVPKILHYVVVGLYSLYIVFLFIPKLSIIRVIIDSSVIGTMLFIIVRAITLTNAFYFRPMDFSYSVAIASLTLVVAIFQIANYFISKRLVQHKEKKIQAGAEMID